MTIEIVTNSNDVTIDYLAEVFVIVPVDVRDFGNSGDYAIGFEAGGSLTVFGEVYGGVGAIDISGTPGFVVTVGETGVIGSLDRDANNSNAISVDTGAVSVDNAGQIFGFRGIDAFGQTGFSLVNSGRISGVSTGVLASGGEIVNSGEIISLRADGVLMQDGGSLINTGEISGDFTGVGGSRDVAIVNHGTITGHVFGVRFVSDNDAQITNYGTISGGMLGSGNVGLNFISSQTNTNFGTITGFTGISISAFDEDTRFINHGTITGTGGVAVNADSVDADIFSNFGMIVGDVDLEGGDDVLRNAGMIEGDVILADGNDNYRGIGDGLATGRVFGGTGNDTMVGGALNDVFDGEADDDFLSGGAGADSLTGGDGDDTLLGGTEEDDLLGGAGRDLLIGGAGDDLLDGGAANDTIFGGDGDDEIIGDSGRDQLTGGAGNDTIDSGSANDTIFGGEGDDEIIGGIGIDTMNGGAGEDTFVFEEGDFGAGASRDRIIGFDVGEDVIDLRGQGLQFGGTSAIGGGQASAWVFETPFGSTLLRVDFDGNGTVDGVILLSGTTGLTVDDVLL